MFRQRVWVASLALWIILALQGPVTGGVPSLEKKPASMVSRADREVGKKIEGKDSKKSRDGDGLKIYRNQVKLSPSQVGSASDTLGQKFDVGSGKSRIKRDLKNEEFYNLGDFYLSGLNFDRNKLYYSKEKTRPERDKQNGKRKPLEAKKYAEHKWQITQVGSTLNEAKLLVERDTASFDREKLNPQSPRLSSYEENRKSNKYEEESLVSNVASFLQKSSDNEKAYFSTGERGGKLKDKSTRTKKNGMIEDNDESQKLGVFDKKMQRYDERFTVKEKKSFGNTADKEIDVKESLEFVTTPVAASAKAQIIFDDEKTRESFNDLKAKASLTRNVKSDSYRVSDNKGEVKSATSSTSILQGKNSAWLSQGEIDAEKNIDKGQTTKNDNCSISGESDRKNFGKGEEGGSSRHPDSQGAIKCFGKTKFNKKLPIELSPVNYAGYIETERSESNIERNLVRKHETQESYRRTDVARDMSRRGDANELAYSETGFTTAEISENVVREIGLPSAVISRIDKNETFISHTPSLIIQLESNRIQENSEPELINDELLKTPWEQIHPRGEISEDKRDDLLLQTDETLSEISGTISEKNVPKKVETSLENRDSRSVLAIGTDDHVPRDQQGKITVVSDYGKENEHLGIIETLNGGYLGARERKISDVERGGKERTTMSSIRAMGTLANSSKDNKEQSKKLRDIKLRESSFKVNGLELSNEGNISGGNKSSNESLKTRIPNFVGNQQNADLEIKRIAKIETRGDDSNDTQKFEFLFRNSTPIQDREIQRNEDVEKTGIDVRGKSSGNLLLKSQRDGRVIINSKFIVRNSSEKLEEEVNKDKEDSLFTIEKIEENVEIRDTREKLTPKKDNINLSHVSSLFESNTDGKTGRDPEININMSMTRPSAESGLTVNLLAGKKNGEVNRGVVSWTMGKKKTNLPDKLWSGKTEVGNLSALDISGYGFLTERYFDVNPKNNDQAKLSEKMSALKKIVEEKETFSKLKEPRKFILNDKYLVSKSKRDMKIIPESTREKIGKETTLYSPSNLEDGVKKALNVSVQKISNVMNKSETSRVLGSIFSQDSIPKYDENKTRNLSKSSDQSVQLFSGKENLTRLENSTEMNVFGENINDITATENPGVPYSWTITSESNQTYSNDGNGSGQASRKILEVLTPLNSGLLDQEILSSFPDNLKPTGIPPKTTLDMFEVVTQSLNSMFSFNQTDSDNTSPLSTAINQWPVKHSAVVEGDLVLGGLMMVHEREDFVTCGPVMPQGGVQALEAMLYTLDRLNEKEIIPGVKIGAHILDDCDKDTYGLEMAVDFIKGSISNIDGAEYHCNKTAVRKVISGVVGAASSVTSIQVANLLRLFRIPQVSFFSTSPELSNKQRFEYFTRTIPSDHYQVKAMVDIVKMMNWSYVSIIYEESNYGIKAFEELEELLAKRNVCIAIKEKLVKDSGVAEEIAYDNIVQKLLTKPRARGCIIFGSDQEVAGVMRAVRRCNATGAFSWIGSDGWSARGLVSDGNEPEVEGTLSVQPQANPVKGFEEYFLNLTVENNRRNPWFVEFWEDHFQCRYPNASWTPYNQKYTKPCTTKERLSKQNTAFEDQLQFVSDAVTAFAYAFRNMHNDLCGKKPGLCDAMKPTKGTELLKYLRNVTFEGLSGDKFRFDKNGDGPARYNIIHFKQLDPPGKYKWVRVGEYIEGELRLNVSNIRFRHEHPTYPESVCSLPCEVGQAKKYVEGESCCWHCFNCTQYQVRDPQDETQCIPCPQGRVPDETHSNCRDIPEEFLRPESGWAIGAMSFSATGILVTLFVGGVFLRHNDTPVVRASGRELSYVLLTGILLCYLVTFALVLRPNNIVCGIQRFGAGFCFTVVYAALLTKTNRISRIFNAGKQSAKRPSFISPRSQLIICSGLMGIQILINGVWMIIDPAKAMHHYPTREDNLLVCSSYIDASYMIAFTYPIILIVVCTVYAVLTRKIPEAFNESKHIGFTMYTTCVIWLAFVPLYFGTGNHVALRITSMSVTISLSASVTIACLFSPKLYIILIRPERNVRQSMMPARYSTTKSSAVTGTNASSMMAAVTLTAATCDQNKAVKRHVTPTIDCSTQSERNIV